MFLVVWQERPRPTFRVDSAVATALRRISGVDELVTRDAIVRLLFETPHTAVGQGKISLRRNVQPLLACSMRQCEWLEAVAKHLLGQRLLSRRWVCTWQEGLAVIGDSGGVIGV